MNSSVSIYKRHRFPLDVIQYGVWLYTTNFIDEVFVKLQAKQHYLWRAVEQDGEVVDVFLQKRHSAQTGL